MKAGEGDQQNNEYFTVAFALGYLMPGMGEAIERFKPAKNTVACTFHERVWIHLGKAQFVSPERLARQSPFLIE